MRSRPPSITVVPTPEHEASTSSSASGSFSEALDDEYSNLSDSNHEGQDDLKVLVLNTSLNSSPTTPINKNFPCDLINGRRPKIFNDMIHPHLELPFVCYKIINTPQFQRLRNLKQLGFGYHVYPSASNNRFEHCIGVSYLAGKYCKILQKNQPELGIDEKDILCLYIGGLCHDLGHGPFSHMWDHFMQTYNKKYCHEEMSIRILDYLIEDNGLWPLLKEQGLGEDRDLVFIKELILGHSLEGENFPFKGREPAKHFLYQIVSNDKAKVDVDKFDYLLRDCKLLNVSTGFDYERVLENSRVFFIDSKNENTNADGSKKILATDNGHLNPSTNIKTTIAYRKKIQETLEDLFSGRWSLHHKAYQHKITKIIEEMVMDGLVAAESYFHIKSSIDGKSYKLSTAYQDISAFMKLTDSLLEQIVNWDNGGPRAKRIFVNVLKRNLYKNLGYIKAPFKDEVLQSLKDVSPAVVLIKSKINYGSGSENPLNFALFYEKSSPDLLFTQKFPDPKIEIKCYVALRPSYAYEELPNGRTVDDITDEDEEEKLKIIEEKVRAVIERCGVRLESE